jgi:hypothetical protein
VDKGTGKSPNKGKTVEEKQERPRKMTRIQENIQQNNMFVFLRMVPAMDPEIVILIYV